MTTHYRVELRRAMGGPQAMVAAALVIGGLVADTTSGFCRKVPAGAESRAAMFSGARVTRVDEGGYVDVDGSVRRCVFVSVDSVVVTNPTGRTAPSLKAGVVALDRRTGSPVGAVLWIEGATDAGVGMSRMGVDSLGGISRTLAILRGNAKRATKPPTALLPSILAKAWREGGGVFSAKRVELRLVSAAAPPYYLDHQNTWLVSARGCNVEETGGYENVTVVVADSPLRAVMTLPNN